MKAEDPNFEAKKGRPYVYAQTEERKVVNARRRAYYQRKKAAREGGYDLHEAPPKKLRRTGSSQSGSGSSGDSEDSELSECGSDGEYIP